MEFLPKKVTSVSENSEAEKLDLPTGNPGGKGTSLMRSPSKYIVADAEETRNRAGREEF